MGRGNRIGLAATVFAMGVSLGASNAQAAPAPNTQSGENPVAALERNRLGAAQGDAGALNNLGGMFEKGTGVPVDLTTAYALYHLAASMPGGDPSQVARAGQNRDAVSLRMSAAQITRAQELITLCYGNDIRRCGETILAGSGGAKVATLNTPASVPAGGRTTVALEQIAGVYVVPALVNGVVSMKFAVDTGATDVSIPADVVAALTKAGLVTSSDYLGEQTYLMADGSKLPAKTLLLRSLKVGDVVVENVKASVAPENGPPLLGQSFFSRLKSWSLNNAARTLIME